VDAAMPPLTVRDFRDADAAQVDRIAVAAFSQYQADFSDWPQMSAGLARMSAQQGNGKIIVSETGRTILGAVVYVPPGCPKAAHFDQAWPIIRMLVVDPACRGRGAGRALTEECIVRAKRDGSPVIALHTSPIMTVALPMYLRMGFEHWRDLGPMHGVPYAVYLKQLES
jgi:ribosomal protein S18 acetylase RimI-like enzyme